MPAQKNLYKFYMLNWKNNFYVTSFSAKRKQRFWETLRGQN